MAIDYDDLAANVRSLITDFGTSVLVEHLDGNQSRGVIVFSSTSATDVSIPEVGTVQGTERVAFIDAVRNPICVGDAVVAAGVRYRIREATEYKPSTTRVGWRVVLDT